MQTDLSAFERYLQETLGVHVAAAPWLESSRLPFFLRDHYSFFKVQVLGMGCLVMLDKSKHEQSPASVRKHMSLIQPKWDAEIVYFRERVTAYNRKRLIEHKIPFVVPGNQMYLPMLGIDLREHFRKLQVETRKFSPATQALIIQVLRRKSTQRLLTPAEAAHDLGYTAMTMTRAFNELESANLDKIFLEGRKRCLRISVPPEALWEKAQPFLRSPVKKRIHVRPPANDLPGPLAGLTALARYTSLSEPASPVCAVTREDWKLLKQRQHVSELPVQEPGTIEIEVWSYPPDLFVENGIVDPFSLYLSLKDNSDERIEAALEEMMRGVQW